MLLTCSPADFRRRRLAFILFMCTSLPPFPCSFSASKVQARGAKRKLHACRLDQPIELDGLVHEDAWKRMEPATDFIQQVPREGDPSSEKTEVRVAFDDHTLYFGIICFDKEPQKILVTQNKRDGDLLDSDALLILLDTFGDGQNGFVFGTNPKGMEYDGQVTKGGQSGGSSVPSRGTPPSVAQAASVSSSSSSGPRAPNRYARTGTSSFNPNWDGVWRVRAQTTERGWEAEFAIPFKTLRFNASGKTPWGVNFMRSIRRRNEQDFWSPIPSVFDLYRVSLAGHLEGVEARLHRSTRFIPYILAGAGQNFLDISDTTRGLHRGGLDLKYTLTSSLVLDATVNTDFAQVEVDEEQVNLTRFNLFFPEKRPFFLENSGIFEFGTPRDVEVFFSRRIGIDPSGAEIPIWGGARVTGKLRRLSLGLLNMQTKTLGGEGIPGDNFSVARLRREFGRRSAAGIIFVQRRATGDLAGSANHNETFGFDANIALGERFTLFSYIAKSGTPGRNGRDHAGRAVLEYSSRLVEARGGYTQVGEDFNPEVGFLRRAGYRKAEYGVYFSPRPRWGPIARLNPHFTGEQFFDFSGNRQSGVIHNDFRVDFKNGSEISFARNIYFERLEKTFKPFAGITVAAGRYPFSEWSLSFSSNASAAFFAGGNYATGTFYEGTLDTFSLNGGFRHGSNFLIGFRYLRNDVKVNSGNFASNLAAIRVNYSLTGKSYLQSLIQYNNQNHQLSGNFRFAYQLTSSTGLFVVYNTHLDTLARGFGEDFHRRTQDRALLVKFSYLFGL